MRISSRAIIFKDDEIVLIYREKNNRKYYVYPGGGQEIGETEEEAVIRECKEELGIDVKVEKKLYNVKGSFFEQNFFLCKWISNELGTGDEEEYNPLREDGLQIPVLIKIKDLNYLDIVSNDITNQLINDIEKYGKKLNNKIIEIKESR